MPRMLQWGETAIRSDLFATVTRNSRGEGFIVSHFPIIAGALQKLYVEGTDAEELAEWLRQGGARTIGDE